MKKQRKRSFFVSFILSESNFFNICVLSQCIEQIFKVDTLCIYQKTLHITLKSLQRILKSGVGGDKVQNVIW